jgi:catechol 2,3-dioxygenase-like lactoylglutathione lyase family enzyme
VETLNVRQAVTFLRCRSLNEVLGFYRDGLGLRLALDQGACLIFRVRPGCFWGFCESADQDAHGAVLTIVTPDVEAWHSLALERGLDVDGPVRENPAYQIRHFYITAPDGARVEVQEFLDPRWDPQE